MIIKLTEKAHDNKQQEMEETVSIRNGSHNTREKIPKGKQKGKAQFYSLVSTAV